MKVSNFKPFEKNTLRGFFTIEVAPGIEISDCTYHVQGERSWFGFPGVPYTDKQGKKTYKSIIAIPDKTLLDKVQREACRQLKSLTDDGFFRDEK